MFKNWYNIIEKTLQLLIDLPKIIRKGLRQVTTTKNIELNFFRIIDTPKHFWTQKNLIVPGIIHTFWEEGVTIDTTKRLTYVECDYIFRIITEDPCILKLSGKIELENPADKITLILDLLKQKNHNLLWGQVFELYKYIWSTELWTRTVTACVLVYLFMFALINLFVRIKYNIKIMQIRWSYQIFLISLDLSLNLFFGLFFLKYGHYVLIGDNEFLTDNINHTILDYLWYPVLFIFKCPLWLSPIIMFIEFLYVIKLIIWRSMQLRCYEKGTITYYFVVYNESKKVVWGVKENKFFQKYGKYIFKDEYSWTERLELFHQLIDELEIYIIELWESDWDAEPDLVVGSEGEEEWMDYEPPA